MTKIVDECIGCANDTFPCLGRNCPNRNVARHFCDKCGDQLDGELFKVDGEEMCEYCLKDLFRVYLEA